jgi:pilin isopeptide linkage protein
MALPDGTYSYTIREISSSGGGWVTDRTEYPVTISVTGGIATVSPSNPPVFINVFTTGAASVTFTASKSAVGAELPAGRFHFGVFDSSGVLIATATNDAGGNVIFPEILFNEAGTTHYTVSELTPSGGGWITDGKSFPATVTVTDNGEGQFIAFETYPNGQPTFVNTYAPPTQAEITVCAKKTVCGACLCTDMFTFGIFDQRGFEVARATNNQNGSVVFPVITISEAGVYMYTVRELNPSGCGWIMDDRSFPVAVTVTDNGLGQLIADVMYPKGLPRFLNRFCGTCSPCRVKCKDSRSQPCTWKSL